MHFFHRKDYYTYSLVTQLIFFAHRVHTYVNPMKSNIRGVCHSRIISLEIAQTVLPISNAIDDERTGADIIFQYSYVNRSAKRCGCNIITYWKAMSKVMKKNSESSFSSRKGQGVKLMSAETNLLANGP